VGALALSGLTILVTRPEDRARSLQDALEQLGATVVVSPTIRTVPEILGLTTALRDIRYDWVVVSSQGAAAALRQARDRLPNLKVPPCATVGPATAAGLRGDGFEVRFQPEEATGVAMAAGLAALAPLDGKRVLYPRSNIGSERPAEMLRKAGATVDEVTAYVTAPLKPAAEVARRLDAGEVDLVLFASPSAVTGYCDELPSRSAARTLPAIAIGPTTAEAVTSAGLPLAGVADPHTAEGLVQAVCKWAAAR